ncbi:hypothetical protein ACP4OV_013338 [Aristida adscensionis]
MALSFVAFFVLSLTIVLPLLVLAGKKYRGDGGGDGRRLPPSPPGVPLLGHLHLLRSLPHRALRSVAAAHGPVVLLRLGRRAPTVVVSSAAAAEEVMRTRDLAFASRPRSAMADRLFYGRDVGFTPYGDYWRQARRICVAHLLSARRVLSFRRVREQEAAALVGRVPARAAAGAAVNLGELLIAYANAVVSRATFGDESARGLCSDGDRGRQLRKVFADFQELLAKQPVGELVPWLGWVDTVSGLEGKIKRTFEALDGVLEKRNAKEHGIELGTTEIKAIIMDMFGAGTDTTTTVMEWAMAELVAHPRSMRALQAEIRGSTGAAAAVTEDHLGGLRYLTAVVKETLRLHAPVPLLVPREAAADAEILGHHVPAGTRVVINAWAIGWDAAAWEDGEEFAPERFLGVGSGVDYRGQDFRFVPFGAGIGFAETTIHMGLASLLYHFDWEAAGGNGAASLDMSESSGFSVHIKSGLTLVAKPWFR